MSVNKKRNFYSILAICLIIFACAWQDLNTRRYQAPEKVIAWDVISYYSYLPATFIEKDYKMRFVETDGSYYQHYWPAKAPNGGLVVKTSMGMSIMYAPFFFAANLLAAPLGYATDGYSLPYAFALMMSCLAYLLIGFFFLRNVLLRYYSDIIVALTLIIIGTGTNLFWYATVEAPMSHGYSFALFCVFLFLTEKWYQNPKWHISVFLGLIFGLITLIRPTNGLIVVMFLFFNIIKWEDILSRMQLFLKNYQKIIVIILCTSIIWLPQLLYWHSITGDWFYYSYGENERFFFNKPKIWEVLFGFRKGWLIYTPVMLFAFIGIGLLWKINRKYFFPILIFFVLNLFVVSSWWCWWYGGGFGMRSLIESYAVLAIPLAAFLYWIATRKKLVYKISLLIIVFAFYCQSVFHNVQYYYGAIHWDSMTKKAYFDSFWHIRPTKNFHSLLKSPDYEAARKGNR